MDVVTGRPRRDGGVDGDAAVPSFSSSGHADVEIA
jgi:hypothetical protein